MWRFTPWSIRNISYGSADYIIFEMETLSCYLFIHLNHIPFIRTSLSLIFYFIIQILFLYPDRHGRSSYSSGIWIFPRPQTSFWILILNSDLLHEIQFPCCVLTCFLLNSRSLPLLIGYPDSKNVLYMRSSVDSPLMMCQASVPFTISSGISETLNRNIFLSSSDIKRRKPQKGKNSQISRVLLRHGFWIFTKSILFQTLPSVPFPWSSVYTSSSSWMFLYRMDSSSLLLSPLPVMILL